MTQAKFTLNYSTNPLNLTRCLVSLVHIVEPHVTAQLDDQKKRTTKFAVVSSLSAIDC